MKRYDLHVHTHYSRCAALKPALILKIAQKMGLDGVAVTDHNSFKGAKLVSRLNKNKDFEIIKGMELSTNKADLLALYLQEGIKANDFFDVLDKIKKQDAVAVIAHPFSYWRYYLKLPVKEIKDMAGLESYNGRAFFFENKKAKNLAERYNVAQTAGSDAHFSFEIGRGLTLFKDDLRKAIKKRKTIINGNNNPNIIGPGLSSLKKFFC